MRILTALLALAFAAPVLNGPADPLERGFADPPPEARLRAYWWWLNGNVNEKSISRDLREMAAKGFGGALICDAGGAEQDGNDRVPHGPDFLGPRWRELYRHALREAAQLGLELSVNIQSGWNLGGPMIRSEDAPKKLVWSELRVRGPAGPKHRLPLPEHRKEFYRDVAVVAYPIRPGAGRKPIQDWDRKALHRALSFSAPDTTPLLQDLPDSAGEEDTLSAQVVELTSRMSPDGVIHWEAPQGDWEILRLGCTLNDHCFVSTSSEGWKGYALDPFDIEPFRAYWQAVVAKLIEDAGTEAGKTLKYLHTDSWEVEVANWTPSLRAEFRKRRGYDLLRFLPVIAGRIVDSRSISNRFLHDFRRTMGDLAVDNHFRPFAEWAHRSGLSIHPESGGPHAVPVDSLRCLGMNDAPMSEFWAWSWRHRVGEGNRFFVKQPASAAHTYGRRLVLAEGFTTIGPHWQETLWDNLKPSFDQAACEGLNRLVWHAFTCSPEEAGLPGQEYFAGTHFNPNSTWWSRSGPFLKYINRCQFMLQRGLFVADVCYYYGDHVPNFAQLKNSDPARILPGYDYDVVTEEVILTRMSVVRGRLTLPDGMSYRVLVLPERPGISLPVLRRIHQLVGEGATVIGPRPEHATGLGDYPECDRDVARLAAELWGDCDGKSVFEHRFGAGRVVWGKTAREFLTSDGVGPDFSHKDEDSVPALDYIHRREGDADIYFVANRSNRSEEVDCVFRIAGKAPELWDPVTGEVRDATSWSTRDGHTTARVQFAPYGSHFFVFRKSTGADVATPPKPNFPRVMVRHDLITGPWTVRFDPDWGGPESAQFSRLVSWTERPEEGIRYYSGTGTYATTFSLPPIFTGAGSSGQLWLDLGDVRQLAEVRLNGQNLGVLWAYPFRVEVTGLVKPTGNQLEVDIVNFWPNRIIGDHLLPPEKRFTRTNIRKLTKETPLVESGLLGPVTLMK